LMLSACGGNSALEGFQENGQPGRRQIRPFGGGLRFRS